MTTPAGKVPRCRRVAWSSQRVPCSWQLQGGCFARRGLFIRRFSAPRGCGAPTQRRVIGGRGGRGGWCNRWVCLFLAGGSRFSFGGLTSPSHGANNSLEQGEGSRKKGSRENHPQPSMTRRCFFPPGSGGDKAGRCNGDTARSLLCTRRVTGARGFGAAGEDSRRADG